MIIKGKTALDPNREFVKVVVDIEKEILSANCELHIDCADELMKNGSRGSDLWGANIHLKEQRIDFVSMINIKPPKYTSMKIQDQSIKDKIEALIKKLIF